MQSFCLTNSIDILLQKKELCHLLLCCDYKRLCFAMKVFLHLFNKEKVVVLILYWLFFPTFQSELHVCPKKLHLGVGRMPVRGFVPAMTITNDVVLWGSCGTSLFSLRGDLQVHSVIETSKTQRLVQYLRVVLNLVIQLGC